VSARPDVLLVSLGTTLGWRMSDRVLLQQLREAGANAEAVRVRIGATDRLRRGYPANDIVEALAARRAAHAAARRLRPRAAVLSATTTGLFAADLPVPYAVRFDAPAAMNRPGLAGVVLRPLERRSLARARLVLPFSEVAMSALPGLDTPVVVLPAPVVPSGPPADEREPLAVAYVPDPKAKGLDIVCGGWAAAAVEGARLEVFGVERQAGLAHLARTGVPEPPGVEWRGMTSAQEFRATLRRARAYVGGARWEDFGQAPLEALADGALLATVPSGGPFEALVLARDLEPSLVAARIDAQALAEAIRSAFALGGEHVRAYRAAGAERLAAYRPEALVRTVEERVLPALLR
jgi:hypothetical protein